MTKINQNGISINAGFEFGSAQPVDSRQWLSTEEMKNADVNTMPDPYFAINKEDHFLYIFSKTNTISESTGYFTKYTNDGGMTVWKGSEAERDALPEETRADESIIFYTWDTASAEYKNVVSKTVGTVENMSEADYQALETKDARTMYATERGIRVGENYVATKLMQTYSTTEQLTGEYWIDGKPIYRKVFTFTDVSTNIDLSELNIKIPIFVNYIASDTNSNWSIGTYPAQSISQYDEYVKTGYYDSTQKQWVWQFGSVVRQKLVNGYFIIEYTKTTD